MRPRTLIFIISALTTTNIATASWAFFYAPSSLSKQAVTASNAFSLLDPSRGTYQQKDRIIDFQPLRQYLDKYEADQNTSIYFEYLPTGASIAIHNDAEFYPASLLKVPVAMAVAKKIERGEWKWTNELVLMSTDKNEEFGTLYKEPTNSTHTIEELVRRSLSDSDNTAHFILVRNLEIEEMKDVYDHMGLQGFLKTDGILSAERYSAMFRTLYTASFLSAEHSQKLLTYLSRSTFTDYIQSALPDNIVFAHKIGVDGDKKVFLDSGIVYAPNRPYILTVMTKNIDGGPAIQLMHDVSEKVLTYINNYAK